MRKIYRNLLSVGEVIKLLDRLASSMGIKTEFIPIEEANGLVCSEDVVAEYDSPPFDRSEVDGYAVISKYIAGAEEDSPVKLKVAGRVSVGETPKVSVCEGEAVEVDTGAVMPRGADAVVMIENTKLVGDELLVFKSTVPGENVASAGTDVVKGETLVRRGETLTPPKIASLAAAGVKRVKVCLPPKVCVISVGSELVEPGSKITLGKVFNVNTYSIIAQLSELGLPYVNLGVIGDDLDLITSKLSEASELCDIIILSGGTSAGTGDLTYRAVEAIEGGRILVHGVKLKPGRPTLVGLIKGKVVIGLPGFPLSALMVFLLLVKPFLLKLKCVKPRKRSLKAELIERVNSVLGVTHLIPVILRRAGNSLKCVPLYVKSGSVSVLRLADGFIAIPEDVNYLDRGSKVEVKLLNEEESLADVIVIGSHDYLLEAMLSKVLEVGTYKVISIGSMGGLKVISEGGGDLGGIHLLDEGTSQYNVPYVRRFGKGNLVLVRGYVRELGLIVARGNPKSIKGIKDLIREDIQFVNRTKGSGARVYLDIVLRKLAEELGLSFRDVVSKVRGYEIEMKTHTGVAAAVSQGRADVGIGIRYAADLYGLDFIKLTEEVYDIVIDKEALEKSQVRKLIDFLQDTEAVTKLIKEKGLTGYRLLGDTGKILIS